MTKLKYTYVYNLLLSIGLGLFIIYLMPDFFNKYKVKLADQSKLIHQKHYFGITTLTMMVLVKKFTEE